MQIAFEPSGGVGDRPRLFSALSPESSALSWVWKSVLRSLPPLSESSMLQLSSSEGADVVSIDTKEIEDSPPKSLAYEQTVI